MSSPVITPPAEGEQQLPPVAAPPAPDPAVARLSAQVAAMQRQMSQPQVQPQQPGQPANKEALEKDFFKNPLERTADIAKSVSEAVIQRGLQEMGGQYETLKQLARDQVRSRNPELFDKYVIEIDAKIASVAPQLQTNINVWQSAFDVVKGEHLSELMAAEREKHQVNAPAIKVSDGTGGPARPGVQAPAPAAEKLSADEQLWADRLQLTPEQYKLGKEGYANQNDRGKSSWDPYITFDSREKARKERASRKPAA